MSYSYWHLNFKIKVKLQFWCQIICGLEVYHRHFGRHSMYADLSAHELAWTFWLQEDTNDKKSKDMTMNNDEKDQDKRKEKTKEMLINLYHNFSLLATALP